MRKYLIYTLICASSLTSTQSFAQRKFARPTTVKGIDAIEVKKIELPPHIRNALSQVASAPSATLTPECNTVTSFDNTIKQTVTRQDGQIRYRMSGNAPAGAMVTDGQWIVPFAANSVTPGLYAGNNVVLVADANFNGFTTPLSLNNIMYPMGGYPVVSFNWPNSFKDKVINWWASNQCNNVPVKKFYFDEQHVVIRFF